MSSAALHPVTLSDVLRVRLRVWWSEERRSLLSKGRLGMRVLGLFFAAGVLAFSWRVADRRAGGHPDTATTQFVQGYALLTGWRVLTAVRLTLERLYFGRDIEVLMAAPVPHRALLGTHILHTAVSAPLTLTLLTLGGLAIVLREGYGAAGIVALAAAISILSLWTSAVGTAGSLALTRLIPPRRLRSVFMMVPMLLVVPMLASAGHDHTDTVTPTVPTGIVAWPAELVRGPLEGRWSTALLISLVAAITGWVLWQASWRLFALSYLPVVGYLKESMTGVRRRSRVERLVPPLSQEMRAVVLKDWLCTLRDPRAVMGLVFPLAAGAFFGIRFIVDSASLGLGEMAPNLVMMSMMMGITGFQAFSQEGGAFALLRQAPVTASRILAAKVAAYALPVASLVTIVALVGVLLAPFPRPVALAYVIGMPVVAVVLMLINICLLALYVDLNSERARSFGVLMAISLLGGLLFLTPHAGLLMWMTGALQGAATGFVLIGWTVLAYTGLVVLYRAAARRLERMWIP